MDRKLFEDKLISILSKCSKLFFEYYIEPYNIIISISAKKPLAPLIEIEKALSHLMQALKDIENEEFHNRALKNLERFEGHFERMLLDLHKLAFFKLIEEAEKLTKNCHDNKLLLKIKDSFKFARDIEIKNLGSSIEDNSKEKILEVYKEKLSESYKLFQKFLKNYQSEQESSSD